MHYDPVKNLIRKIIRRSIVVRRLFYRLLGLFFLREWYVKRTIRHLDLSGKMPLSILDAGSGFGQYTYHCAIQFPHAVIRGIELDETHVKDCRAFAARSGFSSIQYESADLLKLNEDSEFVGEHVRDGYSAEGIKQKLTQAGFDHIHTGLMYGPWGDLAWRLSIRNTMRLAGYGVLGRLAAVPYMCLVFPFALLGMWIDFQSKKTWGTGLIVTAEKC